MNACMQVHAYIYVQSINRYRLGFPSDDALIAEASYSAMTKAPTRGIIRRSHWDVTVASTKKR